ncbi:hypothetical protein O9929_03900 [Vibrio lentus]|nr:hypothetical protein [Vibrio lentus]
MRLFYQGMTAPLPYFQKPHWLVLEAGFSRSKWVDDEEKSLKKMADTFNDSFAFTGEGGNTYISRIWSKWDDELAASRVCIQRLCYRRQDWLLPIWKIRE